jgi:hypothetical protein
MNLRTLGKLLRVFLMGPFVLAMGVLTADRITAAKDPGLKSYPMGDDIIYKGGFVTLNTDGYAVAGQDSAGYKFVGVAVEQGDNAGGSNGDVWVRVYTEGVFLMAATSIAQANVGDMMYLVDDQTFDDATVTNYIPVGILVEYVSATSGWVDIGPAVGLTVPLASVDTDQLAAGAITNTEVDDAAAIATSKLADGTEIAALLTANGTVSALVTSGVALSEVVTDESSSPVTLLAANGSGEGARCVVLIVECIEAGAGGNDIIIGETDTTNKFFATTVLGSMLLGAVLVKGGELTEEKALLATVSTAGSAGQYRITALVLPAAA